MSCSTPCNYCNNPCTSCECENTCNQCDTCCNSTDCPFNLDTDCVFYMFSEKHLNSVSQLDCLGISKGTSLSDILEAIDTRLCTLNPVFNFNDYNLPCLRADYVITDFVSFIEAIDTELCEIKNTITTVNNDITNLYSITSGIITPNIPDCGSIGILPTDTLNDILNKHSLAICALQSSISGGSGTPLVATNSSTIEFITGGPLNHNITANVKVAPGPNAISIVAGGIYSAPVVLPTPVTISECTTSNTISQTVNLVGSDYTICNEVIIPELIYGGGSDPSNCIQLVSGKLFVNCAAFGTDYVSDVQLGPLIGGLSITGVGSAFSGIVDLISADAGNTLSYSPLDGKLFAPSSSNILIDAVDNCPSPFLDDKLSTPIGQLSSFPGLGGWVASNTPTVSGSVTAVNLDTLIIGGGALAGSYALGPVAVTDCDSIVAALNAYFISNPLFSSNNVVAQITDLTDCGYTIFNIPGASSVELQGDSTDGITTPWSNILVFDAEQPNSEYFNKVYKKINDDGTGCKTMELFAYNPPDSALSSCDSVDPANVTILFYNTTASGGNFQSQFLYLDINEPFSAGTDYIIDIEETAGIGRYLLKNHVVKAGLSFIPLVDYLGVDLRITITKDCGCCTGSNLIPVQINRAGSGIKNGLPAAGASVPWTDVPLAAYTNGWGPAPTSIGLQYKIEGTNIYFKGSIEKNMAIPTSTNPTYQIINERAILLSLVDPAIPGFLTADVYNYGLTDRRLTRLLVLAAPDGSYLEEDVLPHVIKDGAGIDLDLYVYNDPNAVTPRNRDVRVSMSSIVVRE